MGRSLVKIGVLLCAASAKNYVAIYPNKFDTCSVAQTAVTSVLLSSVLLNSDSFTTAGSDVLTIINDVKTMESINRYYPKPKAGAQQLLGEACGDIINFVESTNTLVTSLISSSQQVSLKDGVKDLLDNNVILVDGTKLPESMTAYAERYYWQGTFAPSLMVLPECVTPPVAFDPASAHVDFYAVLHKYVPGLLKEGHERIRACDNCLQKFVGNLLATLGYEGEKELYNAAVKLLTWADEHADEMLDYLLAIPEEKFPKTLGELSSFAIETAQRSASGELDAFQNNSQLMITAIDELYAEVAGYGESAITEHITSLVSALGCRDGPAPAVMQRAF